MSHYDQIRDGLAAAINRESEHRKSLAVAALTFGPAFADFIGAPPENVRVDIGTEPSSNPLTLPTKVITTFTDNNTEIYSVEGKFTLVLTRHGLMAQVGGGDMHIGDVKQPKWDFVCHELLGVLQTKCRARAEKSQF